MGEFANTIRVRAAGALWMMQGEEALRGVDPLVELITCVLEDGVGGVSPPPEVPLTLEHWMTWNGLVMSRPRATSRVLTHVLERERPQIPATQKAMRAWAARLLLLTLDLLGTT